MASRTDSRVRYPVVACRRALVVVAWAMSSAWAAEPPAGNEPGVADKVKVVVNPYSQLSNEQLGTLAGTFEELDRDQRRWFLTEIRKRMSGKGKAPEIQVGKDDRFGRVVPDAGAADNAPSDVRKPGALPSAESVEDPKVYGSGSRSEAERPADGTAPALRPEEPSRTRE